MYQPTPAQLALKLDDWAEVARDSGAIERRLVKCAPWRLGDGRWVIGLCGIPGGYALERVQPAQESTGESQDESGADAA